MTIKPADLLPEARITLNQQAATHEEGLSLTIRGTGWVPPDFGEVDWSQPVTVEPVGPVPGNLASVTGLFRLQVDTDLASQQVSWSLTREMAADQDGSSVINETASIAIGLLQQGFAILRTANGTAVPMMAYSKRTVNASGTGEPPIQPGALQTTSFAGINILINDYTIDTKQKTWSISGEEA